MALKYAAITPHPPVMVPDVGGKEGLKPVETTVNSMLALTKEVAEVEPEIIFIITPHGPVDLSAITVRMPENMELKGSLWQFGASNVELSYKVPKELCYKILEKSAEAGLNVKGVEDETLDHGFLAPMFYLDKAFKKKPQVVSMNMSLGSYKNHYEFGKILREIANSLKEKVVFIASGDLSHRLSDDAPGGFNKEGEVFDKKLVKLLKEKKYEDILLFDPFWVDEAGECGMRTVCTLIGVVEGQKVEQKFYSYEGPYGVGYLVMGYKF